MPLVRRVAAVHALEALLAVAHPIITPAFGALLALEPQVQRPVIGLVFASYRHFPVLHLNVPGVSGLALLVAQVALLPVVLVHNLEKHGERVKKTLLDSM